MLAYPAHDLALWDLLEAGRYDEVTAIWDRVNGPLARFIAQVSQRSGGDSRVAKGLMALRGHPMGAPRPPSLPLDDQEMRALRDLVDGFGWPVPVLLP
jgi:dihydrodipicolinate synthase/N-acetylneuraminate lyase